MSNQAVRAGVRSQTALVLAGVLVGLLVAGMLVPLAFGESFDSSGDGRVRTAEGRRTGAVAGDDDTGLTTPTDPGAGSPTGDGTAVPGAGGATSDGGAGATGAPGSSPSGASAASNTASDRGVSPDTIKIGALLLDIATVGRLGVAVAIDPAQQQAAVQSFVDDINDRGGIHGRTLEAHYETFDVTDRNAQIAACRELTQEKKVFTVIGGFNIVDANVCIVEENETPLISSQAQNPDWLFARAGGRLLTLFPRSGRMMASLVAELERVKLAGRKIGILSDELNDPGGQVAIQLERLLEERDHDVVYRGQLSDDIPTASSQVPVEVNRMRTAGGTGAEVVIFLASNAVYGTQFVNQAESQNYHPQYVNSDWASNNSDTTNQNMPRSYQGTIAFTSSRALFNKQPTEPPPSALRCRDIYNARSGRTLKPHGTGEFGVTMTTCDNLRIFEILATAAGPDLTRERLSAARGNLGAFESAALSPGTYGPDKFDLADLVRTQRWVFDCKCWHNVDGFHRPGG